MAADPQGRGDLSAVRDRLRGLDPLAVASAVAALSATPENANALWRLSALTSLVYGMANESEARALETDDLQALLNEGTLAAEAAIRDDPRDGPLTEEVTHFGGNALVGEGLGESNSYAFRHLARGCLRTDRIPATLRGELIRCTTAALTLSDSALQAAGLPPNAAPPPPRRAIEIPPPERLTELQKAMSFDRTRLATLLPPAGVAALEPLIGEVGEEAFSDLEAAEGSGDRLPILRRGEWLILARPFDVLAALRHHIAVEVADRCGPALVGELFGTSVDADVASSLRRLGLSPGKQHTRDQERAFSEISAPLDTDKQLHALVLADDFLGLDPRHPYTLWDATPPLDSLLVRLEEIGAQAISRGEHALCLVISQPAGRQGLMLSPRRIIDGITPLTLTAADLETITALEREDPLALWKFAETLTHLREMRSVTTSSILDVYGSYRDEERSFGAARRFNALSFMPGLGGPYRVEAAVSRERHGVVDVASQVREVERRGDGEDEGAARLYFESEVAQDRLVIAVGRGVPELWVFGPPRDPAASFTAVESVAYWLGELREPLAELLDRLAPAARALQFDLDFQPWGYWFEGKSDPGGEGGVQLKVGERGRARLTFGPAIRRALPRYDNAAERKIVAALIEAVNRLAAAAGVDPHDEEHSQSVLEAAAPAGVKKHLIMLPAEGNPMVEEADGPPRLVQEADRSSAHYRLADRLAAAFGYQDEEIPHECRNDVLKAAVAFLFEDVSAGLDLLQSDGLLEALIRENERLVAASEHRRVFLPARLATYPRSSRSLREEVAAANLAEICCRFLIEYTAASAPGGGQRWSLARHDRALAGVAEMLDWADLSDAVHGGLSDVDLLVRDDGLLRLVESDRYDSGRARFFDRHVEAERRTSRERWAARFEPGDPSESELTRRLDPLMIEEAGVTLTRLGETLVAANHLLRRLGEEVVAMERGTAVAELAKALDRDAAEIDRAVAYLEMGPREEFMGPPDGSKNDVYPWLFARRWSYNRRPFVRRESAAGSELLWGRRHVLAAMNILFGQLDAGKYQALATSPELRRELGKMAKQRGAEFEAQVAEVFASRGCTVRRGVKKIGDSRLRRGSGEDLGDIDVLAADPASGVLWAIECKSLTGTLSSSEVVIEMTGHFGRRGSTSVTRHAERVAWLADHLEKAIAMLGADPQCEWNLHGLIVTGRDVIAPFIDDLPFDLVAVEALPAYLSR